MRFAQKKIFALRAKKNGILARFWTARGGGGSPIRPYIRPGKIRPYLKNFEIGGEGSVRPNTPFVRVWVSATYFDKATDPQLLASGVGDWECASIVRSIYPKLVDGSVQFNALHIVTDAMGTDDDFPKPEAAKRLVAALSSLTKFLHQN